MRGMRRISPARNRRSVSKGGSVLGADAAGPDDEKKFLLALQLDIEARVPPSRVQGTAGTGGTGASPDEEMSDSSENSEPGEKVGSALERELEAASVDSQEDEFVEESGREAPLKKQSPERCWRIISPKDSWKMKWDFFCGFFIIYTIIFSTWRIGFDQPATGFLFYFDLVVDGLFAADTIICFRTGFFDEEDMLVTDSWLVARRYLLSYFVVDVLSWLPITLIVEGLTGDSASSMRSMKLMKIVRLVRLMKLMRLFKLGRFMSLLEEKLDLSPAMIRMVKLIANIVFLAHLLACMWHFIALPVCGDIEDVPTTGPCPDGTESVNWVRNTGADRLSLASRYVTSFYFVTATMMAVGYGEISGQNTGERVYCIILQLFGATSFGFILSSVTSLLESANPRSQEHTKKMNEIKEWIAGRKLPRKIRVRIREHYNHALAKKSIFNEAEILGNMPCSIRMDVIQKSYQDWLVKLARPFALEDLALRIELVQLLQPQQVLAKDVLLEEGEISSEVILVLNGCLEAICNANQNDISDPKRWVHNCLRRSRLGDRSPFPDEEEDNMSIDSDDEPIEVLCGVFLESDLIGQLPAVPVMVRGFTNSTEVLVINKDGLADVQSRFPGALARAEAAEEVLRGELVKVLESDQSKVGFERSVKATVLMNSVAVPCEQLPFIVTKREHEGPISTAELSTPMTQAEIGGGDGASSESAHAKTLKFSPTSSSNLSSTMSGASLRSGRSLVDLVYKAKRWVSGPDLHKGTTLVFTSSINPITDQVEVIEETQESVQARWIILPTDWRKLWWDMFVGALIVYSVLLIPWRISFDIQTEIAGTIVDVFVDIMFACDMVFNFRTALIDNDGITDTIPCNIARAYIRGWFLIDLGSTFPVDRIAEIALGDSGDLRALKMIRMVRLVRLLKLARMLKMGKIAQKMEDLLDLSPLALKCLNLGGTLTFFSHFLGCFWFYVSTHNDVSATNECESGKLGCDASLPPTTWWKEINLHDDVEDSKTHQYIAAVYWAFTTMTTVGYGDIHPRSDGERIYAIVAMIFGATMFGYIIGSIAALAGQERGIEAVTKKRLSMVRNWCEEQMFSETKIKQVLRHYQFLYQERSPYHEHGLILELPNFVRKEVQKYIYDNRIKRIGLFVGPSMKGLDTGHLPDWFICWAMRLLEPQAMSPGEIIVNAEDASFVQEIFFVCDGECEAYVQKRIVPAFSGSQGGHSDTGGSTDLHDEGAVAQDTLVTKSPGSGVKIKTMMVFSPGCFFGLEHLAMQHEMYSARCSKSGPAFLYTLRQSTLVEVQPDMVKAIQMAILSLTTQQVKSRIPQKNLEARRGATPQTPKS
eukprot:CAMPEP_0197622410 /NCGR_PEP_ID=MMETSP1338-20131121/2738_1 /TAXON_ID=43686 ORGANISM="Pelagodinium beii, Strain RCC1491" /NCGR_SAMPLE_ID=MMETSP1338 /ASSEMBLY_ACC=CAM_ASM_000754 /LENGTH=1330 /DNA_ID=CAMNT_0043192143 /DNA_START=124 /DNA_END=4116 /DNA_ORIENTATION=-